MYINEKLNSKKEKKMEIKNKTNFDNYTSKKTF